MHTSVQRSWIHIPGAIKFVILWQYAVYQNSLNYHYKNDAASHNPEGQFLWESPHKKKLLLNLLEGGSEYSEVGFHAGVMKVDFART